MNAILQSIAERQLNRDLMAAVGELGVYSLGQAVIGTRHQQDPHLASPVPVIGMHVDHVAARHRLAGDPAPVAGWLPAVPGTCSAPVARLVRGGNGHADTPATAGRCGTVRESMAVNQRPRRLP